MNPDNNTNNNYSAGGTTPSTPNFETYDPIPENPPTTGYDQATANYQTDPSAYATGATGYADPAQATAYSDAAQGYTDPAAQGYATTSSAPVYADPATQGYADPNAAYAQTPTDATAYSPADPATTAYNADPAAAYASADPTSQAQPASPDQLTSGNFSTYTSDNIANSTSATLAGPTATDKKSKKSGKNGKKVSPVIIIAAVAVVVALIVVAVIMLLPSLTGSNNKTNTANTQPVVVEDDDETAMADAVLTCSASVSAESLATIGNPLSATRELTAAYNDDELDTISITVTATYSDALAAFNGFNAVRNSWNESIITAGLPTDPFTSTYRLAASEVAITHEATLDQITTQTASLLSLNAGSTDIDTVETTYEGAGYSCTTE